MANFDGEYEVRIFYTVTITSVAVEHRHTFDVDVVGTPLPGSDFEDITVALRGGGSDDLANWMTTKYLPVFRPLFDTTTDIIRAELWYAAEATEDFTFIAVDSIGLLGTGATAAVVAQQATMTYRSALGGVGRMQFMEPILTGNLLTSFPSPSSAANSYMAVVVASDSPVLARDNSYPVVANKLGLGQNEALYRRRFRA